MHVGKQHGVLRAPGECIESVWLGPYFQCKLRPCTVDMPARLAAMPLQLCAISSYELAQWTQWTCVRSVCYPL